LFPGRKIPERSPSGEIKSVVVMPSSCAILTLSRLETRKGKSAAAFGTLVFFPALIFPATGKWMKHISTGFFLRAYRILMKLFSRKTLG
jgi:hypothetical protein